MRFRSSDDVGGECCCGLGGVIVLGGEIDAALGGETLFGGTGGYNSWSEEIRGTADGCDCGAGGKSEPDALDDCSGALPELEVREVVFMGLPLLLNDADSQPFGR